MEILFPYGETCFASKAGQLAGQPLRDGRRRASSTSQAIGGLVLWEGAQAIRFEEV